MILWIASVFVIVLLIHVVIKIYLKLTCGRCKSPVCLNGKTVLITGGCTGIGYETALALASRGCRLIIADKDVSDETKLKIISETNNTNIVMKKFDLSSFSSIRNLARDIMENEQRLDILINNAGNAYLENSYTEDGLQSSMQVNHFGPFLLTNLLLDHMKKSAPSRIIFLVSEAAFLVKVNPKKLNAPKSSPLKAYSWAKLCTMATVSEFSRRLKNTEVTVNCLHPGIVNTLPIQNQNKKVLVNFAIWCLYALYSKSPEEGAQTAIHLAVSKDVETITGEYFQDCHIRRMPKLAIDTDFSKNVWNVSQEMIKLNYFQELEI